MVERRSLLWWAMATKWTGFACCRHRRTGSYLEQLRKPAFHLSDVVRYSCSIVREAHWRRGRRVCLAASSGQAPTPHSGVPKARTERSSMVWRCMSSSDTVRQIKYQILQISAFAKYSFLPLVLGLRPLRSDRQTAQGPASIARCCVRWRQVWL